jgi:hypothetical protein
MGYESTCGPAQKDENPPDIVMTYEDRWMWDITMYLLNLRIKIYDGRTGKLLAVGESYQTSLVRKSTEETVQIVLRDIFSKAETQSSSK